MRLLIHSYFLTKQCCYIDHNKGKCFTESYSQGQKECHNHFKIHSKMFKKLSNKSGADWHSRNITDLTTHHKLRPWIWPNDQPKQTIATLTMCYTCLLTGILRQFGGHTSELLCSPESRLKETWSKLTNTWFSWRIVTSSIMTEKPKKQSIKQITKYTISKTTHSVIVVNINLMQ